MAKIDTATKLHLTLATGSGTPQALSNMIACGATARDVYEALVGCEWDADVAARALNKIRSKTHTRNWEGVRTTPRCLVVKGYDSWNNPDILYIRLDKHEPDMTDGVTLSVALTNTSRAALALCNIVNGRYGTVADFVNYFYDVADKWSAEAFAKAANKACADGLVYNSKWEPELTRENVCHIKSKDRLGNEHLLMIRKA